MERCAQLMHQFAVPLCAARTWKSEHYFYEADEPGSGCDGGWILRRFEQHFSDSSSV